MTSLKVKKINNAIKIYNMGVDMDRSMITPNNDSLYFTQEKIANYGNSR